MSTNVCNDDDSHDTYDEDFSDKIKEDLNSSLSHDPGAVDLDDSLNIDLDKLPSYFEYDNELISSQNNIPFTSTARLQPAATTSSTYISGDNKNNSQNKNETALPFIIDKKSELDKLSSEVSEEDDEDNKNKKQVDIDHILNAALKKIPIYDDELISSDNFASMGFEFRDPPQMFTSSDDDSDSATSQTTSVTLEDLLANKRSILAEMNKKTQKKTNFSHLDLPPVEYLSISLVGDLPVKPLGIILHFVDNLVVIQSDPSLPALDEGSVVFDENRKAIGRIFETFGSVGEPCYTIRFNNMKDIEEFGLKLNQKVFYVHDEKSEFSKIVDVDALKREKGTDGGERRERVGAGAAVGVEGDDDDLDLDHSNDDSDPEVMKEESSKKKRNRRRRGGGNGGGPSESTRPTFQWSVENRQPSTFNNRKRNSGGGRGGKSLGQEKSPSTGGGWSGVAQASSHWPSSVTGPSHSSSAQIDLSRPPPTFPSPSMYYPGQPPFCAPYPGYYPPPMFAPMPVMPNANYYQLPPMAAAQMPIGPFMPPLPIPSVFSTPASVVAPPSGFGNDTTNDSFSHK